jgi:hypothetical protein
MIESILTDLLRSHNKFQVLIKQISKVSVVVWSLKLQSEQLDNMLILDFHSWKESIEVLYVFEN